jgi:hypothetical protein
METIQRPGSTSPLPTENTHPPSPGASVEGSDARSSQSPLCWICRGEDDETEGSEPLTKDYCRCRGTMGSVHRSCLESYVTSAGLASCKTCNRSYYWTTEATEGAPPFPESTLEHITVVFESFLVPYTTHVLVTLAAAVVKYALVPLMMGIYYSTGVEEDEAASLLQQFPDSTPWPSAQPLWRSFLVGMVACWVHRAMMRLRRRFYAYFEFAEADPVVPARRPAVSGYDFLQNVAHAARSWIVPPEHAGLKNFMKAVLRDVVWVIALCYVWRRLVPTVIIAALIIAVACRVWRPPGKLADPRFRQREALQRRAEATATDVHIWFVSYTLDLFFFSISMPILAGFTMHYATAPYLCAFPTAWYWPTPESLLVHWMAGFVAVYFMVTIERIVMVPLFALGTDLFILRSVVFDEDQDNFDFVYAHLFEVDPLRTFQDAVKMYLTEVPALAIVVHAPIAMAAWALDTMQLEQWLPLSLRHGEALQYPLQMFSSYRSVVVLELYLAVTVICCFHYYAVQRPTIRIMLPIAKVLSRVLGLDKYLFDPVRKEALENWLTNPLIQDDGDGGIDVEAMLPQVPPEHRVTRRERWLEEKDIPAFLTARRFIFACVFFPACYSISAMLFVVGAICTGTLSCTGMQFMTLPAICIFALWDVRRLARVAFQTALLVLAIPVLGLHWLSHVFLGLDWSSFSIDVFAAKHNIRKRLSPQPPSLYGSPPGTPLGLYRVGSRNNSGGRRFSKDGEDFDGNDSNLPSHHTHTNTGSDASSMDIADALCDMDDNLEDFDDDGDPPTDPKVTCTEGFPTRQQVAQAALAQCSASTSSSDDD